ncbi:cytochrome P450 [Streptomyces sp. NPDC087658]|uniref:cytochrome P450 n=1 Tax=Streptomyces sp. NPDC087658 TaxID=3365800 RepID=UPI00381B2712
MTSTAHRTGEPPSALPEFPMTREARCPFDPPPALRSMQQETRLKRIQLWDGSTPWIVTRYEDQRSLLSDPRVSADRRNSGYPHQVPSDEEEFSFIQLDDPEHARQRRMVTSPFTIKRVEAMRPSTQRIADDLIDQMSAGPKPVDLVEAFALPLPSLVISDLLGVPYSDHNHFQENSKIIIKKTSTPEERDTAVAELASYLGELMGRKTADPKDDLLSSVAKRVKDGELTPEQGVKTGMLMLIAGHETTANMIALGALALLEHPDQMALLRDTDDPKLLASATEELLRYLNIIHTGGRRVALVDIEIADQVIRAGEGLIMPTAVANRDADLFPEPDRLDIQRDARRHIAFGFGVHQCLGQPLARMELQVAYGTLFRRIPDLRLATSLDKVTFKGDGLVYGVYELPVTW